MKLSALAIILLLISSVYTTTNGQEQAKQLDDATKLKIQKLRDLENQLNSLPASAKVKSTGDDDSSTITIEWKETSSGVSESIEGNKSKTQTKRLIINLNELDVPDEYIEEKINAALTQSKCGELDGAILTQVGITRDYELVKNYEYKGDGYTIHVLVPFVYDRASIPRGLWVFLDKDSLGNVAPLIHDLLYRHGGVLPPNQVAPYRKFSRKDADKLFREVLRRCGVSEAIREAAYIAVRSPLGKRAWKGRDTGN